MDNALGVPALVPEAIVLDLKRRAERPTARRLPLSEIKPGLCNRIGTSAFDGKGGLPISGGSSRTYSIRVGYLGAQAWND